MKRITLTMPNGSGTITVDADQAEQLKKNGYTEAGVKPTKKDKTRKPYEKTDD